MKPLLFATTLILMGCLLDLEPDEDPNRTIIVHRESAEPDTCKPPICYPDLAPPSQPK